MREFFIPKKRKPRKEMGIMGDKRKDDIFSESDSFWDLDLLLPKQNKHVSPARSFDTASPDFKADIPSRAEAPKGEKIPPRPSDSYPPISSPKPKTGGFDAWLEERKRLERSRGLMGKRTLEKYRPSNPYIKSVTVSVDEYPARTGERFLSDAERLFDKECEFSGNVPFESYYPQYSLMKSEQESCYIGFRTLVRKGEYPAVDRAYIYLYLYELINLSSYTTPYERAMAVCGLINAYSDCDGRLFSDMCNWLADICLIYKVELPENVFGDNISRVVECASVKEFFIRTEKSVDAGIAFILGSGRYDYRKSRFYSEYKAYYDKYINSAVCSALKEMAKEDSRFSGSDEELCTLTHESYFGALCTAAVRRTVSLECVCVTRSETVKRTVTELIKYAENILRKHLGIKPRLTVNELSLDRKALIKKYFAELAHEIPPIAGRLEKLKVSSKPKEEIPEYEHLYEPKSTALSYEEAERIEKESWGVTEKLIIPDEDYEDADDSEPDSESSEYTESEAAPSGGSADTVCRKALAVLLDGGSDEFCVYARENGYIPDALADEINGRLYDILSDVAIIIGDGYEYVPDYEQEIRDFINS